MYILLFFGSTYCFMSAVSFYLYTKDKRASIKQLARVSERTLWIVGLMCGWPGALIAQKRLRHKTAKPAFLLVFWLTVVLNLGMLMSFCWYFM
jgi:uncharacterized membrane protein YsdA (DUF1294 family)